MRVARVLPTIVAIALLAAVGAAPGCSKKSSNPVAPTGGGGGNTFDSGSIGAKQSFAHTFGTTEATIGYHCAIHPAMQASVKVISSAASSNVSVSIVNATASGFSPLQVEVKPGGTVTWTNNDSRAHTATSN